MKIKKIAKHFNVDKEQIRAIQPVSEMARCIDKFQPNEGYWYDFPHHPTALFWFVVIRFKWDDVNIVELYDEG